MLESNPINPGISNSTSDKAAPLRQAAMGLKGWSVICLETVVRVNLCCVGGRRSFFGLDIRGRFFVRGIELTH